MPYLNLDLNYFNHIKTKRLVGLLGRGSEVLPIRLWCFCGTYLAETGALTGISVQEIEAIVQWWGKEGEMVKAMVQVEFLEHNGSDYVVHGWSEHAGHLAMFQARARAAAQKRWGRDFHSSDATSIASSNATSTAPTKPNLPNQTNTKPPPASCVALAGRLRDGIFRNNEQARITEAQLRSWAVEADRMIRLDHRSEQDIGEAIDWSQSDPFWLKNILSMAAVRKHFDRFLLSRKDGRQEPSNLKLPDNCVECGFNEAMHLLKQAGRVRWIRQLPICVNFKRERSKCERDMRGVENHESICP